MPKLVLIYKQYSTNMITMQELLMERIKFEQLPQELQQNATHLLECLNKFRVIYGKPMIVSSGYRTPEANNATHGASKSAHLTCEACDFRDIDGVIKSWVLHNMHILEDCGLYMESAMSTKSWIHLQTRPTKNRVFIP